MSRLTCADAFNSNGVRSLRTWRQRLLLWIQRCVEQRVDQCRFSKPRLAYRYSSRFSQPTCILNTNVKEKKHTNNHGRELETLSDTFAVDLVWKVGETDVTHELFPDGAAVGCGAIRSTRDSSVGARRVGGTIQVAISLRRSGDAISVAHVGREVVSGGKGVLEWMFNVWQVAEDVGCVGAERDRDNFDAGRECDTTLSQSYQLSESVRLFSGSK